METHLEFLNFDAPSTVCNQRAKSKEQKVEDSEKDTFLLQVLDNTLPVMSQIVNCQNKLNLQGSILTNPLSKKDSTCQIVARTCFKEDFSYFSCYPPIAYFDPTYTKN